MKKTLSFFQVTTKYMNFPPPVYLPHYFNFLTSVHFLIRPVSRSIQSFAFIFSRFFLTIFSNEADQFFIIHRPPNPSIFSFRHSPPSIKHLPIHLIRFPKLQNSRSGPSRLTRICHVHSQDCPNICRTIPYQVVISVFRNALFWLFRSRFVHFPSNTSNTSLPAPFV